MTAAARRILDHLDGAENPPRDGDDARSAGSAAQPGGARVLATA
ncbi:hypothetical protein [Blastococcus saxobsidens]|uniref:Uncharacterized protein n=1 Tax=Blastococcus saxobsidens (strain DD2) TaxID=1146883 RepID=H6RJ45_BLASD|nr:hypothetical protein [Blastococcus saxobsidens]CCG04790.1 protein of unknown function [Blastococcus saxobsidens DD2]